MLKKLKRTPWMVMLTIGFVGVLFAPTIRALVTKVSPAAVEKLDELSETVNKASQKI